MTHPAGQSTFEWAHELKGSVADSRIGRKGYSANPLKRGGAACVTRTRDPIITNDVLYQLS